MNLKYLIGSLASIPLLPVMYYQGKKVKREVPLLPEPKDIIGSIGAGADFHLLLIGESTIAGVGSTSHREGFTGELAALIAQKHKRKVHYEVFAKSGYTAAKVSNKLISKIQTSKADLIVIGLGANDAFTLNTPRQWAEHNQTLLKKLQHKFPGVPIVYNNMPPIKFFPAIPLVLRLTVGNLVGILGEELKKLVLNFDKVYYNSEKISLHTWGKKYKLDAEPNTYFSDGIHPAPITYGIWAREMFGFIEREEVI